MSTFFGLERHTDARFELRAQGECGASIRKASLRLSSFSPQFGKDLSDLGVADSTDSTQPLFLGPCVPLLVGGRWDTPLAELRRGSVRVLMLGHQAGPAVRMGRALGEARVIALGAKEYTESERDELRLSNQAESGRGDGHSRGFYHGVLGCAFPFSEFIDHHAVLNEKKPASRIAVFEKVLDQAGAQERATLEPEDGRGIRRIARAHLDSLEEPFEGAE